MKTHFSVKLNRVVLFFSMLLLATVILFSGVIDPSKVEAKNDARLENATPGNKWEYKSILLAPGADEVLNMQVSDFNWEYLGTTSDYALFRRAVYSDQ
ncbi:MAG: hypothetical protein AAF564_23405 [Bacteroidota bacterium]